jgi:hypothetical protein
MGMAHPSAHQNHFHRKFQDGIEIPHLLFRQPHASISLLGNLCSMAQFGRAGAGAISARRNEHTSGTEAKLTRIRRELRFCLRFGYYQWLGPGPAQDRVSLR